MADCCDRTAAEPGARTCPACGVRGASVQLQTVKALLTEIALTRVQLTHYRFCSSAACDVVYFGDAGDRFGIRPAAVVAALAALGLRQGGIDPRRKRPRPFTPAPGGKRHGNQGGDDDKGQLHARGDGSAGGAAGQGVMRAGGRQAILSWTASRSSRTSAARR